MKANELRIGNYVFDRYKITQVDKYFYQSAECFWTNEFKPIPLTEEWLLKFGFEKKDDDYIFNGFSFTFDENTFYNHVGKITNIYYVHQLQNLYFALTNDELTIKK